ncbi:protein kinase C-binding protein NELL1 isoform X2 [Tribolium castaneum]|uniref:protein kinase C-binding protein NELL1 isoform X2 n=1 Tax=Tribolium castaneum TaxID=7070 RepID=UPI00077DA81C|nr:PREDICTED: protein kinase C-binding protein NELL1 isoform X2 [Tribolium castaneum]|eukprot:XP_015834978.1 PREDICTED: protein kinase C-binding protein NELL1 isoform X2 [Tribolium castaneum]
MACCLVAAWTTLLWLASATGLDPTGLLSSATSPDQSIDLLGALGSHNSSWAGVTLAQGPQQIRPAYYLQGDYRDLKLPAAAFQQVSDLLRRSPEFTISAWLRQEVGNTGSIVSFAHGLNRYLELQSSGRKNEIRLHYTSRVDSKVYVETFHYRLADNLWHHVAVSVSGSQAELLVDCHPLYKRLLRPGAPDRNFTEPQQLWLGQRNKHYHFKGAMQDVRLIGGPHGYLSLCPSLDSTCPTCGQFSLLQNTVQELTRHLQELSERLVAAEGRISKVEECDCQKSCHVNGTVHADGATWQRGCDLCACVHGEVQCRPVECPELPCKHPVNISGECCQSCLRHCLFYGAFYDHGELVTIKKCVECECQDGSMQCTRIDPETMCPKLTCPPDEQFSVADNCCKFCPGVDYCAKGHVCHANATCLNLQTTYACQCDQGFQGDGRLCTDINECQQEGGLEGHHCHQNTRCVNTPGSYTCECLAGYRRVDKFNCAELDECSSGEHNCDVNADCINTQGSYHCVCKEGYTGDGYNCQPVCNQSCLNGGICRSPGKCACPNGYTGSSCERDLDECATNAHRCTEASVCVNMIGWYYCKCKEGYQSPVSDNNLGTLCQDIDECVDELHTCHPTAQCVNVNGGFRCECPPGKEDCRLSCMFEGTELAHGLSLSPQKDPCQTCTCNYGVITCDKPHCNCSLPGSSQNPCCPQCDKKHACKHQELTDVVLMHGEQWSYQCQTCECLYGEVDCWEMKCPPLLCDNPVQAIGDCCPHCDDLCPLGNASTWGQPCTFAGRMYESGAQFADPNDPCVSCNCKVPFCAELDGVLCCSYNYHCGNDTHAVGFDGVVASTGGAKGHSGGGTGEASAVSDFTKQYSAALRVANSSAGVVYVSDSMGGNKTEQSPPGG